MSSLEEDHVRIREHVLAEARRLAREALPIASERLVETLAVNALRAAVLQGDPLGWLNPPEKRSNG